MKARRPIVFLTGKDGQLGRVLTRTLGASYTLVATGRAELDIGDRIAVADVLGAVRPDVIVNAAAYTDVDGAEKDVHGAFSVNRDGVAWIGESARANGVRVIHISTDFVFDGRGGAPYAETQMPNPINVYGDSKLAGERILESTGAKHIILRTSWLFSEFPGNFVSRMFGLIHERETLSVVDDQIGTPTDAGFVAAVIAQLLARPEAIDEGAHVMHVANAGAASRFDVAAHILSRVRAMGGAPRVAEIRRIATKDYPLPAARPADSRLDIGALRARLAIEPPDWRTAVDAVLTRLSTEKAA